MSSDQLRDAVHAIQKLNPHPNCHAIARWVPDRNRYEFPIIKAPLTDELAEKHACGKCMLGAVGSDQDGYTTLVGLDIDKHVSSQRPDVCCKRFVQAAAALDIPVVVHSSKSGKGAHVRTLFKDRVPTYLARALYLAVALSSGVSGDKAMDKVWPPAQGLGVLALPYNAKAASTSGGTLALNPFSLDPLPKGVQLSAVLDTNEMTLGDLEGSLKELGIKNEKEAMILSGTAMRAGGVAVEIKDGADGGIQHMMRCCDAVGRLQREATEVSYEFWFGMMTNFKPFIGGYDLFRALSEIDVKRFSARELDRSWKAISGKPRLCAHLDSGWECPKAAVCPAKSPAGLPFGLQRAAKLPV